MKEIWEAIEIPKVWLKAIKKNDVNVNSIIS